ncbi:aldehyde dehydrogenase family protein [Colwellia sp. BRX10-3]|uniref:aldehyde dehydrogenase family protein n=1 Tax=Colwellia sp. BRX10-3 TaxID=2759844 RepID=UPI0015F3DB59|nr:aldehyde dehydrogenase family protein [Colwellia sp. BRX10-3]MBA6390649.1 aldehyde dehydrogenase family protein [Colwellia sp. BRX10-3]
MKDYRQFYINGQWVNPLVKQDFAVFNPATEQEIATISLGSSQDVDLAVAAAKNAFATFGYTSVEERISLLESLLKQYMDNYDAMAHAISLEMGAPIDFSTKAQAYAGKGHIESALATLKTFEFSRTLGNAKIVKEPIGVCGFITPWNWPINQIACKVAPALATGCSMILKPSEIAPLSAKLFSQMIHDAGYPAGVYNMVNGDGMGVGSAISAHKDIDMVSFTGSTRAGIAIAKSAANTVKRVVQELGGKSPNIILDDANIDESVKKGVFHCMSNTGQSCNAPTRMLIPANKYEQAVIAAKATAAKVKVGNPAEQGNHIGPLVSAAHFEKVQAMIQAGIDEGATLLAGGVGKPEGFETGYFVKPTIFSNVTNDMSIAQEEIFGPVLVMIPYKDEDEVISIANDTPYGLAAFIQSESPERAEKVARKIRAGMICINGAAHRHSSPFGGFKQSGNGREWGEFGFEDFLEIKSISS